MIDEKYLSAIEEYHIYHGDTNIHVCDVLDDSSLKITVLVKVIDEHNRNI